MYRASHPIGPRLPVVNRRVTPTESNLFVPRDDVFRLEVFDRDQRICLVRLYERALTDFGGAGVVVRDTVTGHAFVAASTWPPSVGSFYVSPYTGWVAFNAADAGRLVQVSYQAMGSMIDAEDTNWLFDAASVAATPYQGPYLVDPGATVRLEYLANGVWEVVDVDTLLWSPPDVEVKIKLYNNKTRAYGLLTNKGATVRTFYIKPMINMPPEK